MIEFKKTRQFTFRSVAEGEELLRVLQLALKDIANQQLEIERVSAVHQMQVVSENFLLQ